ncbi:GTP cyclohydrolase FolE2 [Aquipseudomonas alcaligenes]|jgi:GTP cyclohydrolase I|uniref:GTP cyclohydrolase FolE2 n=1 Tax=Aquipseudomonas alcaligenes TaxID=43263 RepID=A0AA37CCP1_AQUAC|nr:GTP cyclohydrolase FolE2 [Pseudomonas alcaligenes]BCR26943.1 GTP cyclohydrolase FolE2 [Pseudomonas alcaligenes]GIZ65462.1 GTP cyclohydrolase FolE2 [Pseudomonas alcaligenes]GIZ69796.1 GTP cyclohydrolase FolE2 [Pseudomonas alcaligenes]GIZ74148.1 GTP cyclohydrolase FolE2 [Pseudomonas alcaligenes]GIZ81976.1 GTP cyclohydrolase FolE2 [Pseudomonas alcaligenes]
MNAPTLPDIAMQISTQAQPALDFVGMQQIALPVQLAGTPLACRVDAGVSLDDASARGIHMSRLYLALQDLEQQPLTLPAVQQVLRQFLDSHAGLAQRAYLNLRGELLLKRPALISPLAGWKAYPVALNTRLDATGFHVELQLTLGYSSTCPCSAALARQLIQQRFIDDFAGKSLDQADILAWLGSSEGILATPHSQRSEARLQLRLDPTQQALPLLHWLDSAEAALGTALQTAVKRADEQAFALANGQNLMFCEDAARRLHRALRTQNGLLGFALEVVHAESLHAHDAVAQGSWNWR